VASSDLLADDGRRIPVCSWQPDPDNKPTTVVQIFHGLGEHAGRYERFAAACNERNLAVVSHDHRGHGETAAVAGHFADHAGWDKLIADALQVQQYISDTYPGTPIVLLGHSMGSYIAQSFVMRHPQNVSALILSASTFSSRSDLRVGHLLASLLALTGKRRKSMLLDKLGFGAFNKAFEPARTAFDWLSRDEAEVDQYVSDPLCGGPFSNQLWSDLTGGLLEITSANAVAVIPKHLPILILGGQRDPVGGAKGLSRLADVYRRTGHTNLTLKVYDDGRHEMLNEINRDEVSNDILRWIGDRELRGQFT